MHATEALREAERLMTICNACRYCEGLCAVFPAMEKHRSFASGDLNYLANLCHSCGACYRDCQFSPPHEFSVNVPRTLARVRNESYKTYAWPGFLAGLFERNGLAIAIIAALSVTIFIAGFIAFNDPAQLFAVHTGEGAFYRLMPHNAMVAIFGAAFAYAIVAIAMGCRAFWNDSNAVNRVVGDTLSVWQAVKDAASLRYLDAGGLGCTDGGARSPDRRRLYHHLTFYGFLLCFAATSTGTVYHYGFGWQAPYPWWDLPPMFGKIGGVGIVVGTTALLAAKWRRDASMADASRTDMDVAFLVMLFLTALTGLALHGLRATPAMGMMLALHLGVVFGFFVAMPYGKFVHGIYRLAALTRFAMSNHRGFVTAAAAPRTAGSGPVPQSLASQSAPVD
jgi:citrate/tricarballylate utilization protein